MSKVLIWMPVYNGASHLRATLDSVLAQTHTDFTLLISDDRSTDESWGIIKAYALRDERIEYSLVRKHLAGIPFMGHIWRDLHWGQQYTIHIGHHDLWPPKHLETLVAHADACPPSEPFALIYTDTWAIDDAGAIVGHYKDVMQVGQMGKPMIPQYVITGVSSPQFFGLWNESVRRRIPIRHECSGFDHLIIAEAALHGTLLFDGGTSLLLRAASVHDSLERYGQRHLDPETLAAGPVDFLRQLEWAVHLVEEACVGIPEFQRMILTASMVATYSALRGVNLNIVPGALEAYNTLPEVQQLFSAMNHIDQNIKKLLAASHIGNGKLSLEAALRYLEAR